MATTGTYTPSVSSGTTATPPLPRAPKTPDKVREAYERPTVPLAEHMDPETDPETNYQSNAE
jgi:hypothetical protein